MPEVDAGDWLSLAPRFSALQDEPLTPGEVAGWLHRWSDLQLLVWEQRAMLKRDRLRDLRNAEAEEAFTRFGEQVLAPFRAANQRLAEKLLAVEGYSPAPEHEQMVRRLRAEAGLFREENLPIQAEIDRLTARYDTLAGSMRVVLDGREMSGPELEELAADADPSVREAAWLAQSAPWLEAREPIGELFLRIVALRRVLASNAGLPDYRAYRWREMGRLDYGPADAETLDRQIAAGVVPLAGRLRERRRAELRLGRLRPWDLAARPEQEPSARLFLDATTFEAAMAGVFERIDPELGLLFGRMRDGFLDLGWRPGKPGGGEEWLFPVTGLPCVRLDREGTPEAVALLLHEMGHAFHDYLALANQRLFWNLGAPTEFEEFAAISMPYLAAPYLRQENGGFFSAAQSEHALGLALEEAVARWLPYIGQVDAFQHWLYTVPPAELTLPALDARWRELRSVYSPWVDWSGLEEESASGWQRVGLLFGMPFYMLEYGLAHLGALQLWRNSLADRSGTWRAYRAALALGNTRPLQELYSAAGASLPFEPGVVAELIASMEPSLPAAARMS